MSFDFSDLELNDTTDVELDDKHGNELFHKDGGGNRASITVYGPGTKEYAKAEADARIRNVKTFRNKKADPEGDAAAVAAFLADITKSINHLGIKPEDQNRKFFREFYLNQKIRYIRDKVNDSAGDTANF